jgi:hypothetical protein
MQLENSSAKRTARTPWRLLGSGCRQSARWRISIVAGSAQAKGGGDDLSTTNKMFHEISMGTFVHPFGAFDAARF